MTETDQQRMGWNFRLARREDAAQLSQVAQRIFRDTFAPFNTPADMDLYCSQAFTPEAMQEAIEDPETDIILALSEDRPAGYAHLHRGTPSSFVSGASSIELKRFYIEREWHGTGLALELMGAVAEQALEHGAGTLWLGVWEENSRAIRFYRKLGFAEVGEQSFQLGDDLQRDLVMSVPIRDLRLALEQRSRPAQHQ